MWLLLNPRLMPSFPPPAGWEAESCRAATCEKSSTLNSRPKVNYILASSSSSPVIFLLFFSSPVSPVFGSELGCVSFYFFCSRTHLNWRCDRDLTPSCLGHASGKLGTPLETCSGCHPSSPSDTPDGLPSSLCVCVCVSFPLSRVWMGWSLRLARPTGDTGVCWAPTLWPCRHKGAGLSTTRWDDASRREPQTPQVK